MLIKAIGIGLYILTSIIGLCSIFSGAFLGFMGLGPDGSVDSVNLRIWGVAIFFLGAIYVTPVLAFSRKSLILGYAIAAIFITVVGVSSFMTEKSIIWNSWMDWVLMACLMLVCPLTLAGIAFIQRE
ncbi:MAG: hypothetical protein ABSE63_17085 [Thermoguttaceae bacterium]|jgi:hypothetical protein